MFIIGNILIGIAAVLNSLCFLANILIIASVIISWVGADPRNQLVRLILQMTEPVYSAIRRKIPTTYGSMDLTPIIALLIILFIQNGIIPSIHQIAFQLKG